MKKSASLLLFCLLPLGAHAACHVTASPLSFGAYDVFDPLARPSAATLTVWCDPGQPADVTIGIGPSARSGSISTRQMQLVSGTDRLNYNLFTDASLTSVWGDGTAGASVVVPHVTHGSGNIPVTVYGAIPAGQDVSAGTYSDSVLVTVTP